MSRAVLLGAGTGTRLQGANAGRPKPLLELDGRTLLDRSVELLRQEVADLDEIVVVVGHRAQDVRAAGGDSVRYVVNADFASTSTAASLALALGSAPPQATVVLNGDLLLGPGALGPVAGGDDTALCQFDGERDDEQVTVVLDGDRITSIGKQVGGVAEAVGAYRLGAELVSSYLQAYRTADRRNYYEDVLNRLLADREFRSVPLATGAVALEIDTPEDLDRARAQTARL